MRYIYGWFRTRDEAKQHLEHMFASGQVSEGEKPEIEATRIRNNDGYKVMKYALTLEG